MLSRYLEGIRLEDASLHGQKKKEKKAKGGGTLFAEDSTTVNP